MKNCSKWNRNLPESKFHKRPDRPGQVQSICKECFNKYCIERWHSRKLFAIELLGGIYKDCRNSFHPDVFDFHHRNRDEKEMSWVKMRAVSKSRMLAELAKCDLLCANCHCLRHANLQTRPDSNGE